MKPHGPSMMGHWQLPECSRSRACAYPSGFPGSPRNARRVFMYGFYYHFNNLRFKHSHALCVLDTWLCLLSSEILKCRLLIWLADHPMKSQRFAQIERRPPSDPCDSPQTFSAKAKESKIRRCTECAQIPMRATRFPLRVVPLRENAS